MVNEDDLLDAGYVKQSYERLAQTINWDAEIPEEAKRIVSQVFILLKDMHLTLKKISEK